MPSNSSEYMKKYYEANKAKILNQVKDNAVKEVECLTCKKMIKKSYLKYHTKTKMHLYIIANPQN